MDDAQSVPASEGGPRTIHFTRYRRVVLPLDGFVFWVRAELTQSTSFNSEPFNTPLSDTPAQGFEHTGALHYETSTQQLEDESYTVNRVIFTTKDPIVDLNRAGPDDLYVGEVGSGVPGGGEFLPTGTPLRFAFSSRGWFFEQAGIHHYSGAVVYSDMATQLVDDAEELRDRLIVSNSLPLWLALSAGSLPLYPSFLVPGNLVPPFASVHVEETEALTAAPVITQNGSHDQFCRDRVRVTLWGLSNEAAMDFVDLVNAYSLGDDAFGIMNMPVMRDEKRTQSEFNTISQKKTISYDVSYHQGVARSQARRLIEEAIPAYVLLPN